MIFRNPDSSRPERSVIKHWSDRVLGIVSAGFLVSIGVRVWSRGFNHDASAGTFIWFGGLVLLLLHGVWVGVKAWRRSEPEPAPNPLGKRISDEVMDFGHGEFDPVFMRRSATRNLLGWSCVTAVGILIAVLDDGESRVVGLVIAGWSLLFVTIAAVVIVRIDRKRAANAGHDGSLA